MNLQDAQILTGMIVIAELAGRKSKELDKRVNVGHLAMMLSLVHLPVLLQYSVYFVAEGNVLMANDANQDMQKDDILRVL